MLFRKPGYPILVLLLLLLLGAGWWSWKAVDAKEQEPEVRISRYDRVLDEYVSLGSYTALHRMNTQYPAETKLLIEDVLRLGHVDEPHIEQRLRHLYLDSTMQVLLDEVHRQYADLSDVEEDFRRAFDRLREEYPDFPVPHVYTQIACFGPSVVVRDTLIGICLDKYLGSDFSLYQHTFTEEQRARMNRKDIVPDAIRLYLQSNMGMTSDE